MSAQIQTEHFTSAICTLLDETFDNVQGIYLDKGTSLFETLATISAEEASLPVGGKCATLHCAGETCGVLSGCAGALRTDWRQRTRRLGTDLARDVSGYGRGMGGD